MKKKIKAKVKKIAKKIVRKAKSQSAKRTIRGMPVPKGWDRKNPPQVFG